LQKLLNFVWIWDRFKKKVWPIIVIRLIIFPTFVAECITTTSPKTIKPFSFMKFISPLTLSLILSFFVFNLQAQLFEDFEAGSKSTYAPFAIELSTGDWMFDQALIGNLAGDKKNGLKSARIQ
jgi:hypothetical protein